MTENNRPEETGPDSTHPAEPGERNFDESTYFGYTEPPAAQTEPPQASGKYLWMGFGVVVLLIAIVVGVVVVTGQSAAETPAPATLSQTAAEGKQLFLANNCADCHPKEGRAGGTGPRLSTTGKSDSDIANIILRGKGSMPSHSSLSNDQIARIIAYIRAIKPPPDSPKA
jgi:mono/diheme cytochrome c family protein